MGRKIVLTGTTLTDTSAPKLATIDTIESSGSLMLLDFTHPANPLGAGVPTDGSTIPNLLAGKAAEVIGGPPITYDAQMARPAGFTGTAGLIERTAKGGIHGISPQSGTAVANTGPVITFPTELVKYTLDHPDNHIYVSLWAHLTRLPTFVTSQMLAFNSSSAQTNNYLAAFAPGTTAGSEYTIRPNAPNQSGLREAPSLSALGNKFISTGSSNGWVGTLPNGSTAFGGAGIPFGSAKEWTGIGINGATYDAKISATCSPTYKDAVDSHIVYRVYIEDLTVSGRTYADVDAIDYALYTREVLTPGGRYYGDTFTDPATIP